MNAVLNHLPIFIEGSKTLEIDLKSNFCILHSMFTLIPTKANGKVTFRLTNAKNNSIEIAALVNANSPLPLAYKPSDELFDSANEEFYFLEITPENDLEGSFSWAKNCTREMISSFAR